jgi:hypothetical protein
MAAQSASVSPFGVGCMFNGQTLAIGNNGLPQLGQTFQLTYTGPNFTFNSGQQIAWPNLALSFTQMVTNIPQGLLPQQPAGCTGYIDPLVVIGTQPDINGRPVFDSFVDISVPNNASLLGLTLFGQWMTIYQQCGFAGCGYAAVLTSDAAVIQVGT